MLRLVISGPYSRFTLLDVLAHLRQKSVSKAMNYFYFLLICPELVWTQRLEGKSFAPAGDRTPIARLSSP
jgi:hypothetical protein